MKCFAFKCPLNTGADWQPTNCMRFVKAPQPLKEFLYKVYVLVPLDKSSTSAADKVYNRVYAPDAQIGEQFPLAGPNEVYRWQNPAYSRKKGWEIDKLCFERIYLSMEPAYLARMFQILCDLADRSSDAIVTMKRSTGEAAERRPDSIVVYTSSSLATKHVLNYLQTCMRKVRQTGPTTFGAAPLIQSDWFRFEPPAGTRSVGMQGIGVAQHPHDSNSFGAKLCGAVGEAIEFTTRHGGGIDKLTKTQFACVALGMLEAKGMDPARPWNLGYQSPSVL